MWPLWEWGWVEGWELSKQIQSQDKMALPWPLILLRGRASIPLFRMLKRCWVLLQRLSFSSNMFKPFRKNPIPITSECFHCLFFGPYFTIPSYHSSLWKQSFLWLKRKNSPGPLKFSSWHLVTYTDKVSKRKGRFWFVEVTEEKKNGSRDLEFV